MISRNSIKVMLCLCVAAFSTFPLGAAPKKRLSKKEQAEKQLRAFYLNLDRRLFGEKDYKDAGLHMYGALRPLSQVGP